MCSPCYFYQVGSCHNPSCKFLHKKIDYSLVKTKMCFQGENCKTENCKFAHSKNELRTVHCIMGPFCSNKSCKFEHLNYVLFQDGTAMYNKEKKEVKNIIEKTKLCRMFFVGCHNPNCSFAHSKEELKVHMCNFGENCKNQNCMFYHPEDVIPEKDKLMELAYQEYENEMTIISSPSKKHIDNFDDDDIVVLL